MCVLDKSHYHVLDCDPLLNFIPNKIKIEEHNFPLLAAANQPELQVYFYGHKAGFFA
jgi:hypothetical protein